MATHQEIYQSMFIGKYKGDLMIEGIGITETKISLKILLPDTDPAQDP